MIIPADSAPQAPGQMPAAPNSGPAPVPYGGGDQGPEPPGYHLPGLGAVDPGPDVLAGIAPGNAVQEWAYAHDLAAHLADAPYYPGEISPIQVHGDADAGGRDDVAGTVAASVAAATARYHEHWSDTLAQGSVIGDLMTLPPSPLDPAASSPGTTLPAGGFYDPPRDYGDR